jgi:hypothetical protein
MKAKRYTEEQIIAVLKEAEAGATNARGGPFYRRGSRTRNSVLNVNHHRLSPVSDPEALHSITIAYCGTDADETFPLVPDTVVTVSPD